MSFADKPYDRSFFLDDDSDEAGVRWEDFITALAVWWCLAPSKTPHTVRSAAETFDVTHDVIRAAVKQHYWMFLTGSDDDPEQRIEMDGE